VREGTGAGKPGAKEEAALNLESGLHVPVGDQNRKIKFSHIGFHFYHAMLYYRNKEKK
jgi:hypothetical protein